MTLSVIEKDWRDVNYIAVVGRSLDSGNLRRIIKIIIVGPLPKTHKVTRARYTVTLTIVQLEKVYRISMKLNMN